MTLQPVGTTDRITVGIHAPVAIPSAHPSDDKYYTLDGKLVRRPHKNRLYIHNGKKILMK
jgi:hypothetical protein